MRKILFLFIVFSFSFCYVEDDYRIDAVDDDGFAFSVWCGKYTINKDKILEARDYDGNFVKIFRPIKIERIIATTDDNTLLPISYKYTGEYLDVNKPSQYEKKEEPLKRID